MKKYASIARVVFHHFSGYDFLMISEKLIIMATETIAEEIKAKSSENYT